MRKSKWLAVLGAAFLGFAFTSCTGALGGITDQLKGSVEKTYAEPVTFTAVWTDGEEQSVSLSMETKTAGAKIYYTTDGSIPTAESTEYTGELTISAEKEPNISAVKAVSVKEGIENSPVSCAFVSFKEKTITETVEVEKIVEKEVEKIVEKEVPVEVPVDKDYASAVTFTIISNDDGSVSFVRM